MDLIWTPAYFALGGGTGRAVGTVPGKQDFIINKATFTRSPRTAERTYPLFGSLEIFHIYYIQKYKSKAVLQDQSWNIATRRWAGRWLPSICIPELGGPWGELRSVSPSSTQQPRQNPYDIPLNARWLIGIFVMFYEIIPIIGVICAPLATDPLL